MFATVDVTKSQHHSKLIQLNMSQLPHAQQILIQLPTQDAISLERLASLNSFSLKNIVLACDLKQISYELRYIDRQYDQNYADDPLYNVLSLKNGKSQYYHDEQSQAQFAYQFFSDCPTNLTPNESNQEKKDQFDSFDYNSFQATQSKHGNTTPNEASMDSIIEGSQKNISTKNVTKNMGKLLFKFIWKNRMNLRKKMNVENSEWQLFMGEIRKWKKENNITREYLNNKWHSDQPSSKLFRTISHHFFRKRCLSAIIESNIQNKEMHIKRLKRFQEAASNPKALDNLN